MINRIIASYILFACLIAIALKLVGVDGTIHLGDYFQSYLVTSSLELENFKIAIPLIKRFEPISSDNPITLGNIDSFWDALQYVKYIWQTAITSLHIEGLLNGIVDFLNMFITLLNTIFSTLELIFIFIKNLIVMKDDIVSDNVSSLTAIAIV